VAQGIGPEFKVQNCKNKVTTTKTKNKKKKNRSGGTCLWSQLLRRRI
jgi:hypothetical protein